MSLHRPNPYKALRRKERLASSKASGRVLWGEFYHITQYLSFTLFVYSAITKPAVGVFDLASNLSEGLSYHVIAHAS